MSKTSDLDLEIRAVRHLWRNRISFSTTKALKMTKKWNWVTHKRVSRFFRLYTQILNFNMYMLVSHRNMISIYDMTNNTDDQENKDEQNNGGWIKTFCFTKSKDSEEQNKDHIRHMFIKKRTKADRLAIEQEKRRKYEQDNTGRDNWQMSSYDKFHIVCLSGINTINIAELKRDGRVTLISCAAQAPGRVLQYQDDQYYYLGTIMLVESGDFKESEYTEIEKCRLFKFPFKAVAGAKVTLYAFKMLKFYSLLSSNDTNGSCVATDSVFNIMQSNRSYFERKKVRNKSGNDKDAQL